jgi:hypothetical protein
LLPRCRTAGLVARSWTPPTTGNSRGRTRCPHRNLPRRGEPLIAGPRSGWCRLKSRAQHLSGAPLQPFRVAPAPSRARRPPQSAGHRRSRGPATVIRSQMACIRSTFSFGTSAMRTDSPMARQPLDRTLTGDSSCRPFHDRISCLAERPRARQVRVIAQTTSRVLQRQLADLPVDPRLVDRHRLVVRPEGRDDGRHRDVVQRDAGDLGAVYWLWVLASGATPRPASHERMR